MGRNKGEFDDYIEQNLERGDRSRSEREPTRTCGQCSGRGNVTEMQDDGVDSKGRPRRKNATVPCSTCRGSGVR